MTTITPSAPAARSAADQLQQALERELADLPPLPLVATRLVEALGNTETAVSDLSRLIGMDQAIAAKVLRLVNSSYYGFPRQVTTISQAVVVLGFNTVRNLALAIAAFDKFGLSRHAPLDATKFWEHAVAVAVGSQVLAKRKKLPVKAVEEAFLAGLLHDIGKLFLCQHFPNSYRAALEDAWASKTRISVCEQRHCGETHATVGKRIGERWNLPPGLVATIWRHHEPARAETNFEPTALVNAADALTRATRIGFVGDPLPPTFAPEVTAWLQVDAKMLAEVQQELKSRFEDAREFLQIAARGG
jgi:putative nucleotidyltransferase with HDIG domain